MIALAPHIRTIADQDGAIILDIKRNANFGLDQATTFILTRIQNGSSIDEIVKELAETTGEAPSVVESDVLEFIADLRKNKIILDETPAPNRMLTIVKAFLLLILYDMLVPPIAAVRRRSLWRIHRTVTGWTTASLRSTPGCAAEICWLVEVACKWYPKEVKCLQRSVATTYLLRSAGIRAQLVVGGVKLPFEEHAWVEVDGKIINDKVDYVAKFIVFERC